MEKQAKVKAKVKANVKAKTLAKNASGNSTQFSEKRQEKTAYFSNKTSRQAKAQVVEIYGKKAASTAGDLNKIAAKQKGYTAAFTAQQNAVKKKRAEAQTAIDAAIQKQSRLVGRSWLSKTFTSTNAEKTRKTAKKEIKKEEEVLSKLQKKKTQYNTEAAKKVQSILSSTQTQGNTQLKTNLEGKKGSLANTLAAVRSSYNTKRKAEVEPVRAAFQVAAEKKKAMNNVVLNKKLAIGDAQFALEKAQLMISETSGDKTAKNAAISAAKQKIEEAKKEYTASVDLLKKPESGYAIAKKEVETLGQQLVKTEKFKMIAAADLNKVGRKVITYKNRSGAKQDFDAKQKAEMQAFTSSIQSDRKTAKYGTVNKLTKFASESSQNKLIDLIEKSKDSIDPAVIKKAVKAQAVLDILNKNKLLVGTAETLYTSQDQYKVPIQAAPAITNEEKIKAQTSLNTKIEANVKAKAEKAAEPGFFTKLKTKLTPKAKPVPVLTPGSAPVPLADTGAASGPAAPAAPLTPKQSRAARLAALKKPIVPIPAPPVPPVPPPAPPVPPPAPPVPPPAPPVPPPAPAVLPPAKLKPKPITGEKLTSVKLKPPVVPPPPVPPPPPAVLPPAKLKPKPITEENLTSVKLKPPVVPPPVPPPPAVLVKQTEVEA